MKRTFADLPIDEQSASEGLAVLRQVFNHRISRIGILKALLHILACPPVLFSLLEHNAALRALAVDSEEWRKSTRQSQAASLEHITRIVSFLDAAVFQHKSFPVLLESTVNRHRGLSVTLEDRYGTWAANTYPVDLPELLLFVLLEFTAGPLEAYSTYVDAVTLEERELYFNAVLQVFAPALQIDLARVKATMAEKFNINDSVESWLADFEPNLYVTDEARQIATNLFSLSWPRQFVLPQNAPDLDLILLINPLLAHNVRGDWKPATNAFPARVKGYGLDTRALQRDQLRRYIKGDLAHVLQVHQL
ncbi:MAG TPA: oxygenase MpaB family protein [Candidatus Saccharimonas sp.]|nr:oxygenase MpaB family protein [Candidatus Saccharimonas sp.]